MTEAEIIDVIVMNKFKPRTWAVCPNVTQVLPWEADLLAVSASGKIHEVEVKVTASDLKRDRLKKKWMTKPPGELPGPDKGFYHVENNVHFFWYAVPEELKAVVVEVAGAVGAGVIICAGKDIIEITRGRGFRGPEKVENIEIRLHRLAGLRYWCKRLGTVMAP